MDDFILKPIDVMDDDELIAVLTINKDDFQEDYKDKVLNELNRRGVKLGDILKVAEYKFNFNEFEKVEVLSAYEKTALLKEPLDVIYFRNYMVEFLAIQKNAGNFVLHHHNPKTGFSSFFLKDEAALKNSLSEFLSFGDWLPKGIEITTHWETFAESNSSAYIIRMANLLDDIEVNYCINSSNLARFNSVNSPYSIILAAEDMEEAEEVLSMIDDLQNQLHEKLELAESKNDIDEQLKILTELESITPEDPALYYNKAQLLDEKGDHQSASNALIESFNLEITNGTVDDVEETEDYLIKMLGKVENKTNILHCLATITAFNGDLEGSANYYAEILTIDENDSIAHLNLGHHYYSNTEDDAKVKFHFNKLLELEPESEERESIEAILQNLN